MTKPLFEINTYIFDNFLENNIKQKHSHYLNWPLVYLLKDDEKGEIYVGETTDVLTRLKTHSKTERKKDLTKVNIIVSEVFNKSATLDIESNLIRYLAADGYYSLQNSNLGIRNHQYYNQKEVYTSLFQDIWDELRQLGVSRHSLEYIDNSDLFKYSPYKSLSREQIRSLKTILLCLLDSQSKISLIKGGAGTGKSILAIFLMKLLKTNLSDFNFADFDDEDENLYNLVQEVRKQYTDVKIALVIPMASFRKTVKNVFKNIVGLSPKMVITPSELLNNDYDIVLVDEGHRLRRRVNLGPYFSVFDKNCESLGLDKHTASELDWIKQKTKKTIIFYDAAQSIKPSDILEGSFYDLECDLNTRTENLNTQMRVKGGDQYVKFIKQILASSQTPITKSFSNQDYECVLFESLREMVDYIKLKESNNGLARIVAGYAWEWISKNNKEAFDIVIDDVSLRWNSIAIDWVNSANAINEVGCIHTTQGYDLNYTGTIIGPELDYDFEKNSLIVYKERYKDKNGKNSIKNPDELLQFILNIYKTILLRGIKGSFIYVCNPNLRKYLKQYIPLYQSNIISNSIHFVDEQLENCVPYYSLDAAAGAFSNLQSTVITQYIQLPILNNASNYFACKVVGESMNKIIPNGSICLFEHYSGGSRNGLITLVESSHFYDNDFGANYTVKEYTSKKSFDEDGWQHQEIILKPKSTLEKYQNIILQDDACIDLKTIGIFKQLL